MRTKTPCSCCAVGAAALPSATENRPGLSALAYRVGTQPTFLAAMKAQLSNLALEIPAEVPAFDKLGQPAGPHKIYPLHDLKTRDASDPAIALLDAWAIVADVLTFYQERLANEGYLRTAIERRSILELARLIGYKLRPGVASSVYLAYTLDDNSKPLEIQPGARAQSIPGPGELPQSFETAELLSARWEWNNLKPRMTRPQIITQDNAEFIDAIYFTGIATNLKANDPLLFAFADKNGKPVLQVLRKVRTVEPQAGENRTKVTLQLSLNVDAFIKAIHQLVDRYSSLEGFCLVKDESIIKATRELSHLRRLEEGPENLGGQVSKVLQNLLDMRAEFELPGKASAHKWFHELTERLEAYGRALKVDAKINSRNPFDNLRRGEFLSRNAFDNLLNLARPLSLAASQHPANGLRLGRNIQATFDAQNDTLPKLLTIFNEKISETAYQAWKNAVVTPPLPVNVYAMRVTASLFGNTAPRQVLQIDRTTGKIEKTGEWPIFVIDQHLASSGPPIVTRHEEQDIVDLDGSHDKILPDSWVIVDTSEVDKSKSQNFVNKKNIVITKAESVSMMSRGDYGFSGKTTRLKLAEDWFELKPSLLTSKDADFQLIRHTVVHAQGEQLTLAEEPIEEDVCGGNIELGKLYDGLKSGRWLIVSGERTDIFKTSGVKASELVMLANIKQSYDENLSGDKVHSTAILANELAYTYKRDTVTIYGNVVKATHGERREDVLGGGDASKTLQQFTLKQPPLTYVSAPTPDGIASTLQVRVNDVEWDEADSLAGLSPDDRKFITLTDDDAKTTIIFGNGKEGARLPTGAENVKAIYRNGIGKGGNVKAEQISLLTTRLLGMKAVINPLRASGGADKESRDQARRNAPLAVMSLDRLVSTQDYSDFARTFAGIAKASAVRISERQRQVVHVTVAGVDDAPIDENSDLFRNLRQALHQFGDPHQAIQVDQRELLALTIGARVRVSRDHQWESVEPKIRAKLLEKFSFDNRELGRPVFLSEVIATMQQIKGVAYVDVDFLDGVSESDVMNKTVLETKFAAQTIEKPRGYIPVKLALPAGKKAQPAPGKSILPAQLAILLSTVPATLALNPIEDSNR